LSGWVHGLTVSQRPRPRIHPRSRPPTTQVVRASDHGRSRSSLEADVRTVLLAQHGTSPD
jgi:hypothetical protein